MSDPSKYYVDPNFPNPNGPNDAPLIIYGYTPSLALSLLGTILFALSTLLHSYQLIRYRTWYFLPLPIGCLLEVVGYISRTLSAKQDPYNVLYFIIQYFFIVVAPVFFSAAIYTLLSILISAVGRAYSPLPPKLILWAFVLCDVVATIVQVAGAALIGSAESHRTSPVTPNNILVAGLAFQVFSFLVFLVLLGVVLWRARKVAAGVTMMPFTVALVVASLLVYLRTCFRLAESAQGVQGPLSSSEGCFGGLEFAPVVLAVWAFNVWHPGKWVPRYR